MKLPIEEIFVFIVFFMWYNMGVKKVLLLIIKENVVKWRIFMKNII